MYTLKNLPTRGCPSYVFDMAAKQKDEFDLFNIILYKRFDAFAFIEMPLQIIWKKYLEVKSTNKR